MCRFPRARACHAASHVRDAAEANSRVLVHVPGGGPTLQSRQVVSAPSSTTSLQYCHSKRRDVNMNKPDRPPAGGAIGTADLTAWPAFHGVRLTSYGHSFGQVQATANTRPGSLYPARLRDLLRADRTLFANRTANGLTMSQIAEVAVSTWADGDGGLVTLLGNQNSAGTAESASDFKTAVRTFMRTVLGSSDASPVLLVILDTTCTATGYDRYDKYDDAGVAVYNDYLKEVVSEFHDESVLVADPLADGWDPATMTGADGQHPNERGDAHITASCLSALASVTFRPGLNVGVSASDASIVAP